MGSLPTDRPLRVLLGATEVVRQIHDLANGFRSLGHEATTVVGSLNRFYTDLHYDVVATPQTRAQPAAGDPFPSRLGRAAYYRLGSGLAKGRLLPPLARFDVYLFQFGTSLMPANRDYPLIKRSGAKLVCNFLGSDIRHWSATEPARAAVNLASYDAYRDSFSLEAKLRPLRMAELYADALFFQPSYGELAIRPYNHLYLAVDIESYEATVPDREVPRLVHAPSNRALKGTTEIIACLQRLRDEGLRFELRLLENLPNRQVLRELTEADVLVDELNESNYGMLSLEAMASGCAVAAGNRPDIVPIPPRRPVLHLSPENLYRQLRELITNRALRLDLARQGLRFVRDHHQHSEVASDVLSKLRSPRPDYSPSFFAREYRLPVEETISPRLMKITSRVIERYGLPQGVKLEDLRRRGLVTGSAT